MTAWQSWEKVSQWACYISVSDNASHQLHSFPILFTMSHHNNSLFSEWKTTVKFLNDWIYTINKVILKIHTNIQLKQLFSVKIIIAPSVSSDMNHNKDAILFYLTNCILLLAASSSITWHLVSSQHLLRLGCPLLGYHQLLLPKCSQLSCATLCFPPHTCESPSLFLTCFTLALGLAAAAAVSVQWSTYAGC